jgi:hypothetical protein
LKHKNPAFREDISVKKVTLLNGGGGNGLTKDEELLLEEMKAYINCNRINAVKSKLGSGMQENVKMLIGLTVKDAFEDIVKAMEGRIMMTNEDGPNSGVAAGTHVGRTSNERSELEVVMGDTKEAEATPPGSAHAAASTAVVEKSRQHSGVIDSDEGEGCSGDVVQGGGKDEGEKGMHFMEDRYADEPQQQQQEQQQEQPQEQQQEVMAVIMKKRSLFTKQLFLYTQAYFSEMIIAEASSDHLKT